MTDFFRLPHFERKVKIAAEKTFAMEKHGKETFVPPRRGFSVKFRVFRAARSQVSWGIFPSQGCSARNVRRKHAKAAYFFTEMAG